MAELHHHSHWVEKGRGLESLCFDSPMKLAIGAAPQGGVDGRLHKSSKVLVAKKPQTLATLGCCVNVHAATLIPNNHQ
jgi:hypothetical protein